MNEFALKRVSWNKISCHDCRGSYCHGSDSLSCGLKLLAPIVASLGTFCDIFIALMVLLLRERVLAATAAMTVRTNGPGNMESSPYYRQNMNITLIAFHSS